MQVRCVLYLQHVTENYVARAAGHEEKVCVDPEVDRRERY